MHVMRIDIFHYASYGKEASLSKGLKPRAISVS